MGNKTWKERMKVLIAWLLLGSHSSFFEQGNHTVKEGLDKNQHELPGKQRGSPG